MRCKTSWEISGAHLYQPVTPQANCVTDVKSVLKLTPCLLPSPPHTAQSKQAKEATKSQQSERQLPVTQIAVTHKVCDPCYTLYFGPRRDHYLIGACYRQTFWDPKCQRTCGSERPSLETPHTDQLQRRYVWPGDTEPGDTPRLSESREENPSFQSNPRATLRQRPPGNHRRHKPIAGNMGGAILGDHNGWENLVIFFVVKVTNFLPHREVLRDVFLEVLCAGLAQIPWRWLLHCFCRQMIYSTPRVDSFCACCTSLSIAKYC